MESCSHINPENPRPRRRRADMVGFSLVEVSMAIGIVAFGILAVFGLLPTGLGMFRQSMDTTIGSQILQQIISEVQATDFDQLIKDKNQNPIPSGATGVKAIRYFDDQGREVASSSAAIFRVNTRVQPATEFPSDPAFTNVNLATVTVQVAKRPGDLPLTYETDAALSNLWSEENEVKSGKAVTIFTGSTLVSRQ